MMASDVPNAAPGTPHPMTKMKKKLNTTSSAHTMTLTMLGIFMLPAHFSMAPHKPESWKKGTVRAKIRKEADDMGAMSAPPPSQ